MSPERLDELRVALLDLLECQPPPLLHQVDEPQVAGPEDDDLLIGDVALGGLRPTPAHRLVHRVRDHGVLLVAVREPGHPRAAERVLDEVVQPVAVALLERGPLCLAMVREHHDLVGTRSEPAGARDPLELLIELPERLHGVRALEARVMGDLVVARERRIGRRAPPHHVGEDAEHDQVADDDAHRGAKEWVDPAPVTARLHVATGRPDRRRPLEQDLPDEEDQGAGDVEAIGEERAIPRVGPFLRLDPGHGQDHLVGLPREEVPRLAPPSTSRPDPFA
jgi:hypothetical protein